MARTFYTNGILQQQQTRSANTSKIPIYDNESALDADLANIPDNTLVATKGGHDDVIDQMKDYIRKQNVLSDWETLSLPSAQVNAITMEYDGIIMASVEANPGRLYLLNFSQDGGNTWKSIVIDKNYSDPAGGSATLQLNKGDKVYYSINATGYVPTVYVAYYKDRDYTGR